MLNKRDSNESQPKHPNQSVSRGGKVMLRDYVCLSVFILLILWITSEVRSASIPIENASFEAPAIDPNAFPAVPYADHWIELDVDTLSSSNTGVFANTAEDSPDHIINPDGSQLAFLGTETGNGFEQDMEATYKVGCDYRLTVAVGVSWRFPPSGESPADLLELVLYYHDGNEPIDIVCQTVTALPWSQMLQDFSVYLPKVSSDDAWAGKNIGIAMRSAGMPGGYWDLDNVRLVESVPISIPIENASFEDPAIDPNAFVAVPLAEQWTELDIDTFASTNTGVFANTAEDNPDHIMNADGNQLAFLGTETGNGFEQDLDATYKVGCDYNLTVAVGVSWRFPPSGESPADMLELVFYYRDGNEPVDIISQTVTALPWSQMLQDFSMHLPTVKTDDTWADKNIGIALRSIGLPGGFWDLDDVRLVESMPVSIPIENASFESPAIDPNAFPAVPYADQWTELDVDTLSSSNTGVFANTTDDSPDHTINANGSQIAFLGTETGNGFEQDLDVTFQVGCNYRLTVAVGVSWRFPPSSESPEDLLELVFYYRDANEPVDIVCQTVTALPWSQMLHDFSVYLPTVSPDDAWADKNIGIALRSNGLPGGFWDLDYVRLAESLPEPDLALMTKD
jgi:hypothetical protein